MDDKLKQVLHKVELLCEQNPEFAAALKENLGLATASTPTIQESKVDEIEKYLGLDYKLDDVLPENTVYRNIDYSFIKNSAVRDCLICDFREMMRYRCGTRSHKADFDEFCKYAHFQLEGLANYFMEVWCSPKPAESLSVIEKAQTNILANWMPDWDKPKNMESWKTIYDIDYNTKITAILKFLQLSNRKIENDYVPIIIKNIRLVRNGANHRGEGMTQSDILQKWVQKLPWTQVGGAIALFTESIKEYN